MNKIKLLLICVLFLLTSCGFHLRGVGSEVSSLPYKNWRLENVGDLSNPLHDELKRYGAVVVDRADSDVAIFHLTELTRNKDIGSLSSIGTVSEYLLTLRVSAQIQVDGQNMGNPISVVLQRTLSYSDDDLFGKQQEENELWQDMYQDAVGQIVRRMTFISPTIAKEP
ncbi:MAG: hypothetical protein IK065_02435 [Neisseriaceae bacterium]|nr:hypothetical protein [Neisseriaceae bacterium]